MLAEPETVEDETQPAEPKSKLALLLAHEVGDLARVQALISTAETDLSTVHI